MPSLDGGYLQKLKKRSRESHIYRKYQLIGLELAELLNDPAHKSLYIKLAKETAAEKLLQLAKEISQKKHIKNKGAYFMKVFQASKNRILSKSSAKNGKQNSKN